jgi:hypothetical protein
VRLDAAKIGPDEDVRAVGRVVGRDAAGDEDVGHAPAQRGFGDADLVGFRDVKAFEH